MTEKERARRAARRRQAPVSFTAANEPEYVSDKSEIQAAWLCARYNVGAAHARAIAELAFQNGGRSHA